MEAAKESLAPFIKSRDEAAHIRKVLGAHLDSCLDGASRTRVSLALVDPPNPVKIKPETRGLQREYLEALNANIKARQEYEALKTRHADSQKKPTASSSAPDGAAITFLADHIVALKLRQKQCRLQAVSGALDRLDRMPAAAADFLDPGTVFAGAPALPDVPRDAVTGVALDKTLSETGLDELLDRLQKSVLRAKLLLRKEEQLLNAAKKRRAASGNEGLVVGGEGAKLAALTATRDELIGWIETELANAGDSGQGEDGDRGPSPPSAQQVLENRRRVDQQLVAIKHKYDEYIAARRSLLGSVSQTHQPMMEPPKTDAGPRSTVMLCPAETPSTYLLTPYLEALVAVSREQKGLILHKTHLSTMLEKQTRETCQLLDHLAEESQLLPKYPMSGQARRQPGMLGDGLTREKPSVSSRSKRWVFAAEAAKLATLENVVEKTEEGEAALGASLQHLDEADRLLGRIPPENERGDSDTWPPQDQQASRFAEGNKAKQGEDIWAMLDGDLGLIGDEAVG